MVLAGEDLLDEPARADLDPAHGGEDLGGDLDVLPLFRHVAYGTAMLSSSAVTMSSEVRFSASAS